jgi:predicted lipoprotein with Yx(FWY)xxD motif
MKRLLIPAAALVASLVIAACGSSSNSGGTATAASPSGHTVAVKSIGGTGNVLVDSSGKPLYTSNVEANGKVMCTGACTSFWMPLTIGSGQPTGGSGVGKLGVVTRPDGTKQVTVDGKPAYTFSQDSAGKVTGNGFADNFNGHAFKWTVATTGGQPASSTGGSGGSNNSSNSPYGY